MAASCEHRWNHPLSRCVSRCSDAWIPRMVKEEKNRWEKSKTKREHWQHHQSCFVGKPRRRRLECVASVKEAVRVRRPTPYVREHRREGEEKWRFSGRWGRDVRGSDGDARERLGRMGDERRRESVAVLSQWLKTGRDSGEGPSWEGKKRRLETRARRKKVRRLRRAGGSARRPGPDGVRRSGYIGPLEHHFTAPIRREVGAHPRAQAPGPGSSGAGARARATGPGPPGPLGRPPARRLLVAAAAAHARPSRRKGAPQQLLALGCFAGGRLQVTSPYTFTPCPPPPERRL